ncbi:MAG: D-inositol-3-phosphate glycosyltransferase [Chlamydiales bacterium]|nr:D-inositol-3-phosphate glycosyltransferase [Chlamydiales bacterium]
MLHLCVDARLYHGSGIGTHLKAILPFLTQFQLTLLVKGPLDYPTAKQVVMKSAVYSLAEQLELPRKIPRCDLFWSPHFNIPLLPIRAKKRLVTVHDVFHLAHLSSLSFPQKIYAKTVIPAALRLSDYVMTDSQFSADEIKKYCFCPPKMAIVPSCSLSNKGSEQIEGLPERYMLYVGNVKPHKNLARLIEAHGKITEAPPLVVVGKQFGQVDLPSHVHYAGYVPDAALPELYKGADLFVFPSTYEGFGIPPLEAMRYDCPVVAGQAGSVPEICGEAVHYVDPFSIDSIQEGIKRLLNDSARREELVKKGREKVKEYTAEKTAKKFLQVLDACCSRT